MDSFLHNETLLPYDLPNENTKSEFARFKPFTNIGSLKIGSETSQIATELR